jgi:hypothetical protein|tara:strand:- start:246 stop:539 length:294 start_codon:yes stop_codon:yes gene_type:complete
MATIYWAGKKAPEKEVKKALMKEMVDCTDSAFTVRKEHDGSGAHISVYVEKKDPNENTNFVWNKELPVKFMGWRTLIVFVPIGYIKTIMDAPVREWD